MVKGLAYGGVIPRQSLRRATSAPLTLEFPTILTCMQYASLDDIGGTLSVEHNFQIIKVQKELHVCKVAISFGKATVPILACRP